MRRCDATITSGTANRVVFSFQIIGSTLANSKNRFRAFRASVAKEQIAVAIVEAVEI